MRNTVFKWTIRHHHLSTGKSISYATFKKVTILPCRALTLMVQTKKNKKQRSTSLKQIWTWLQFLTLLHLLQGTVVQVEELFAIERKNSRSVTWWVLHVGAAECTSKFPHGNHILTSTGIAPPVLPDLLHTHWTLTIPARACKRQRAMREVAVSHVRGGSDSCEAVQEVGVPNWEALAIPTEQCESFLRQLPRHIPHYHIAAFRETGANPTMRFPRFPCGNLLTHLAVPTHNKIETLAICTVLWIRYPGEFTRSAGWASMHRTRGIGDEGLSILSEWNLSLDLWTSVIGWLVAINPIQPITKC